MKKTFLVSLFTFICHMFIYAQAVYVDCNIGNDNNTGTEKAPVYSLYRALGIVKSGNNKITITKEGKVSLRYLYSIDDSIPIDYVHKIPDSSGYNIGAGLFKQRKQ